mmetsp:Transcript_3602/g.10662  ORF Transcript_3602/g.10662 Transcript_3602/m.10662 type:complete len:458 (-) Transcript_3602:387-1760(-)
MTSQHQFQFPTPPVQTPVQASVRAASERAAAAASAAATPRVLELFASPELRRLLSACCPAAAKLSPERLLDRVRAEAKAAEIVHNFPARPAGEFVDVSMASLEKYGFFLNQWQAQLIPPAEAPPDASPVWTPGAFDPRSTAANASSAHYKNLGPQIAEISIFGCPPFARPLRPTWDEAANRLVYAAHNIRRLDTGSAPLFGNVGAVFRTSRVRKMVEIAPIDTGIWEASCNDTYGPPRFNLDCSYPMAPVGTLDHFDHVLYRGLGSWGGDGSRGGRLPRRSLAQSAAELIARSAVSPPLPPLPPLPLTLSQTNSSQLSPPHRDAHSLASPCEPPRTPLPGRLALVPRRAQRDRALRGQLLGGEPARQPAARRHQARPPLLRRALWLRRRRAAEATRRLARLARGLGPWRRRQRHRPAAARRAERHRLPGQPEAARPDDAHGAAATQRVSPARQRGLV